MIMSGVRVWPLRFWPDSLDGDVMLAKVCAVTGAVVAGFLIMVAMQPETYRVQRSIKVSVPPAVVFEHVNDFHKWEGWSPWAKLDPGMKTTFEGPTQGKGAIYHWVGNSDVGEGRMTILESTPPSKILIKLEFIKPFESLCETTFTFGSDGGKTDVSWEMTGSNNFMSKVMQVFVSMDKMVGGDFEKGLENLKRATEVPSTK